MLSFPIYYSLASKHDIPTAMRWLSGSLNGAKMENLYPLIITVLIFAPVIIVFGKQLDILELGEQAATSLGIHTDKTRLILIISSVLIIALATATTGPIAFVAFLCWTDRKKTSWCWIFKHYSSRSCWDHFSFSFRSYWAIRIRC